MNNRFDVAAATWDENPERLEMARKFAAAILRLIPLSSQMEVLELGCGTGTLALALAQQASKVMAVDISVGMIAELQTKLADGKFPHVTARQADVFTEDLGAKFDVIVSALTLHHIEDTQETINILSGYCRPGGYMALIDLDTEDGSFHADNREIHHFGFDRKHIAKMLTDVGFHHISFETVHERVKTTTENREKSFPMFLAVAQKK